MSLIPRVAASSQANVTLKQNAEDEEPTSSKRARSASDSEDSNPERGASIILYSGCLQGKPCVVYANRVGRITGLVSGHLTAVQGISERVDVSDPAAIQQASRLLNHDCRLSVLSYSLLITPRARGGMRSFAEEFLDPYDKGPLYKLLEPALKRVNQYISDHPALDTLLDQIVAGSTTAYLTKIGVPTTWTLAGGLIGGWIVRLKGKLSSKKSQDKLQAQITDLKVQKADPTKAVVAQKKIDEIEVQLAKLDQTKKQLTDIETHANQLQTAIEKGTGVKQANEAVAEQLIAYLRENPEDRDLLVSELFAILNEKNAEISGKPAKSENKLDLAALNDLVDLVSVAIPDRQLGHQVKMAGRATLYLGQAFQKIAEIGIANLPSAGLTALLGPIGLAASAVQCIYSIYSDAKSADAMQEVQQQLQELFTKADQIEQTLNTRFYELENVVADFRKESLQATKKLGKDLKGLRKMSEANFSALNQKLDRVLKSITAGFASAVIVGLDTLDFNINAKLQLGSLKTAEHEDFLIQLAAWASKHAKNAVFTGSSSKSYTAQDLRDTLTNNSEENLVGYLAQHPLIGPKFTPANFFVWAYAARKYIQLRLATPLYDKYFNKHLPATLLPIFNTGRELLEFIRSLQTNQGLFHGIADGYRAGLAQLCKMTLADVEKATQKGSVDKDSLDLEANYRLMRAYSELAFSSSYAKDVYFSSFFSETGKAHLRLVTPQDIYQEIQKIKSLTPASKRDYALREFFDQLLRTADTFKEVVTQKCKEAQDSHPLVLGMMQELWNLGSRYFPTAPEFASGSYPVSSPQHFTDLTTIRVDDIFFAVSTHNLAAIDRLIATGHLHDTDGVGKTALHYACERGQLDIVQKLIASGANVNAADSANHNPLHCVEGPQRTQIIDFLLNNGADPYKANLWGERPNIPQNPSAGFALLKDIFQKGRYTKSVIARVPVNLKKAPPNYNPVYYTANGMWQTTSDITCIGDKVVFGSFLKDDNHSEIWNLPSGKLEKDHSPQILLGPSPYRDRFVFFNRANQSISLIDPFSNQITSFNPNGRCFNIAMTDKALITAVYHQDPTPSRRSTVKETCDLRIWNLANGQSTTQDLPYPCRIVGLLGEDRVLLQGSSKAQFFFLVCNIKTGKCETTFSSPTSWVENLVYFEKSKTLFTASNIQGTVMPPFNPNENSTIRLWDVVTGKCTKELKQHNGAICALLQGNHIFISIDREGTAIVWDTQGNEISSFKIDASLLPGDHKWISSNRFQLVGDDTLVYLRNDGALVAWDIPARQGHVLLTPPVGKTFVNFELSSGTLVLTVGDLQLKAVDQTNDIHVLKFDTFKQFVSPPSLFKLLSIHSCK